MSDVGGHSQALSSSQCTGAPPPAAARRAAPVSDQLGMVPCVLAEAAIIAPVVVLGWRTRMAGR